MMLSVAEKINASFAESMENRSEFKKSVKKEY